MMTQIVIDELKDAYHRNNQFDKVEDLSNDVLEYITGPVEFTGYLREPDYDLLKAIQIVLALIFQYLIIHLLFLPFVL